ncbi:MAG TPA: DegQ family serine endoprotease [Acidiferrobacterales bacterium]|nr:DegQ family serine endoprotease [Acidiferrobacterales bacterium]
MSLDRRSFRVGVIAGVFLLSGVLVGVLFSAGSGWMSPAASAPSLSPVALGGSNGFPAVARATMPAVVNISTTRVVKSQGGHPASPFMDDPVFRHFFGDQFNKQFQIPRERRENSLGSGVIVSADGYIVTNAHVVDKADEIKVHLSDKREFIGKVVGSDPKSDIAVIKIGGKDLPILSWGDSEKLEVGEYVLAIGNPFGLNSTITLGIVSAVGRANMGIEQYENFIQTDAAINPGNSGGALVNTRGELIGINTAIFSRTGGNMGIGFAIPSNMAKGVMDSLVKTGKVVRGYLGVSIQDVNAEIAKQFGLDKAQGALVSDVVAGSPADKAGIKTGDVILRYDGKDIENSTMLRHRVAETPVGKNAELEVRRDKKPVKLSVQVAEQPKDMSASGESVKSADKSAALAGLEVRNLAPDSARQLNLPRATQGVVVTQVESGSAAEKAGVQPGDVVVELNRKPVQSIEDFQRLSAKLGKKDTVLLLIVRQGGRLFVAINP